MYLLDLLNETSLKRESSCTLLENSAWDRTRWGCKADDCCHRDPPVLFEMQCSSAESMAEAFNRSAKGSAGLAEGLLLRLDSPIAKNPESSVGLEGQMGLLLKGQAVGGCLWDWLVVL